MSTRAPAPVRYLHREVQAREELGHTAVRPWLAALLAGVFLGLIAAVPLLQPEPAAPFAEFAADRPFLESMIRFEDRLEEESWVVEDLLPPVQLFLTGVLGTGNEQVVPGRDGWLFYRPAVDSVTGPGFLEDARPALLDLHRQLAGRGIRMVVLPVPVKAAVLPEKLTSRPVRPPVRNISWEGFVRFLEREEIAVLDLAPALVKSPPQYLATDTHWTPDGMELAAKALADWIRASVPLEGPETVWRREERQVEGLGDLARMLELPAGQRLFLPQRVTVRPVFGGGGWRPDPSAEVLILGDSYTNVYSRPDLGWGTGAGLAEQLAFHLRRPVDRIAVNAGGAWASRQALARELAAGPAGRNRLAGKKVVVVQFSARELAFGDWRRIELPGG